MRNHEKFIETPLYDKWILQGKIWHAYACSPTVFEEINLLLKVAEEAGVFTDVTILPNSTPNQDDISGTGLFVSSGAK